MKEHTPVTGVIVGDLRFQSSYGGGERSTTNIISQFNSRFDLVSTEIPSVPLDEDRYNILPKTFNIVSLINKDSIWDGKAIQVAIDGIKKKDPQTIIFNALGLNEIFFYMHLPQNLRERTSALWRCMYNFGAQDQDWLTRIKRGGLRRMQRLVANSLRSNLAVSGAVADSLVEAGISSDKIAVIPQQIGGEVTPEKRIRSEGKLTEKFLEPNEFGVLVASRVSPEKGLQWLPHIYRLMREERGLIQTRDFKKIRLMLVGAIHPKYQGFADELFTQMKEVEEDTKHLRMAESVTFEFGGLKTTEELEDLYNAYHVLINPSPREGFGRVNVEAMSGGMTVINRRECVATTGIIQEAPYATGLLVDSPQEVAAEVLHLMQDGQLLTSLQKNALQWGNGHFSLERAESELLRIIGH